MKEFLHCLVLKLGKIVQKELKYPFRGHLFKMPGRNEVDPHETTRQRLRIPIPWRSVQVAYT